MAKVTRLEPFLLHDFSRDGVAAHKVIFILSDGRILETDMRESMISQLDTGVGPLPQQSNARVRFARNIKERFIDESHDRDLVTLNSFEKPARHRT